MIFSFNLLSRFRFSFKPYLGFPVSLYKIRDFYKNFLFFTLQMECDNFSLFLSLD
ncbi:hypothetical protein LEP1GSC088_3513 [Leptospira interrogans str. L1207]|nr:hypothetical protein LEP1GSC088_3513 [Leptospira interrogans str. L1207]